jgi:hypothetical protein
MRPNTFLFLGWNFSTNHHCATRNIREMHRLSTFYKNIALLNTRNESFFPFEYIQIVSSAFLATLHASLDFLADTYMFVQSLSHCRYSMHSSLILNT